MKFLREKENDAGQKFSREGISEGKNTNFN